MTSLTKKVLSPAIAVVLLAGVYFLGVSAGVGKERRLELLVNERALRDLHCAVLGHFGPKTITDLQLQDIIIDPKKDCGALLPSAHAADDIRKQILDGVQKLLERPQKVTFKDEDQSRTVVINRTFAPAPSPPQRPRTKPSPQPSPTKTCLLLGMVCH